MDRSPISMNVLLYGFQKPANFISFNSFTSLNVGNLFSTHNLHKESYVNICSPISSSGTQDTYSHISHSGFTLHLILVFSHFTYQVNSLVSRQVESTLKFVSSSFFILLE